MITSGSRFREAFSCLEQEEVDGKTPDEGEAYNLELCGPRRGLCKKGSVGSLDTSSKWDTIAERYDRKLLGVNVRGWSDRDRCRSVF